MPSTDEKHQPACLLAHDLVNKVFGIVSYRDLQHISGHYFVLDRNYLKMVFMNQLRLFRSANREDRN
jgi:hypothetical protein